MEARLSSVATNTHGGARPGAGRKTKLLIDHVLDQTFHATRHAELLLSDDSLLEFARRSYPGGVTERMAELQVMYRDGESREVLRLFAHAVRNVRWVFVARDGTEFESREEQDSYE